MKNFFSKIREIKLRSKAIYYTYHISVGFLIGLLVSLLVDDDKERLYIIGISILTTMILLWLFGGYEAEKKSFKDSSTIQ